MAKKLVFLLFLASPSMATFNGWSWQKMVTISSANVSNVSGVLTNFPVVFVSTDVFFSTNAAGGRQLGSFDLSAFARPDCTARLFVDTETVNNGVLGSTLTAFVRIPQLTTATLISATYYWCAGNSSITTYQGISTATWDAGYQLIYHLGTIGATTGDSTSFGNTATNNSSNVTSVSAQIDGGGSWNNSSATYLDVANSASTDITANAITMEAWVNPTTVTGPNYEFLAKADGTSQPGQRKFGMYTEPSGGLLAWELLTFDTYAFAAHGALSTNVWQHIAVSYDGTNVRTYINGVLQGTDGLTGAITSRSGHMTIGQFPGGFSPYSGNMDEVRLSNVARSGDWLLTEYKNGLSPKTFSTTYPETQSPVDTTKKQFSIQGGKVSIRGGSLSIK